MNYARMSLAAAALVAAVPSAQPSFATALTSPASQSQIVAVVKQSTSIDQVARRYYRRHAYPGWRGRHWGGRHWRGRYWTGRPYYGYRYPYYRFRYAYPYYGYSYPYYGYAYPYPYYGYPYGGPGIGLGIGFVFH
jgi:hypothetical protein